jgi:hypothetical protein
MQRHWSALAGCESARLACHPSIRLPQNDRPSENDRNESGSRLTRNPSCAAKLSRDSILRSLAAEIVLPFASTGHAGRQRRGRANSPPVSMLGLGLVPGDEVHDLPELGSGDVGVDPAVPSQLIN